LRQLRQAAAIIGRTNLYHAHRVLIPCCATASRRAPRSANSTRPSG
jgi:hypothetical protein